MTIEAGLGRFFAAKLRSGTLYSLHRRTSSVPALEEALREYESARAIWSRFAQYARGVYVSDITIGPLPHQRGHWLDRLPAMDADIAAMRRQLASARAQPSPAEERPVIDRLLSDDDAPGLKLRHSPPEHFTPGKPLRIAIVVEGGTSLVPARLFYRHVNQAEEYNSVALTQHGTELRADIPAGYTASEYPLQYFFELRAAGNRAHRFPGFTPALTNQPYYIVRASRNGAA